MYAYKSLDDVAFTKPVGTNRHPVLFFDRDIWEFGKCLCCGAFRGPSESNDPISSKCFDGVD
jgi:hypothetical protein